MYVLCLDYQCVRYVVCNGSMCYVHAMGEVGHELALNIGAPSGEYGPLQVAAPAGKGPSMSE
jgi:hypothetical protein